MSKNLNLSLKFFLGLFALVCSHFVYANPLEGAWQHDAQPTMIRKDRNSNLIFCNEQNNCAVGFYTKQKGIVVVPQWNVTGVLNRAKNQIKWSNGTQWSRYYRPRPDQFIIPFGRISIAGPWVHDGKPTFIQMTSGHGHFILINEVGQRSEGIINDNRDLVLPYLNVKGHLVQQGKVIKWSNGTTWYRP